LTLEGIPGLVNGVVEGLDLASGLDAFVAERLQTGLDLLERDGCVAGYTDAVLNVLVCHRLLTTPHFGFFAAALSSSAATMLWAAIRISHSNGVESSTATGSCLNVREIRAADFTRGSASRALRRSR
jgi:hypothetical protein